MNKEQIREEIKRKRRARNKIKRKMMYTRRFLKNNGRYCLGNYNWIDIEEDKKRLTKEMKDLKKELEDLRK